MSQPATTPRMSDVARIRRSHLQRFVDLSSKGLEFGPYSQPTVFKSEGDVRYLDRQTREALVAAVSDPAVIADIPEIDYVVPGDDYPTYVRDTFDYVIANHVLEHAPNFIQWLRDVSILLNPGGVLFLALPDKKFTFDKYRHDTPLSHVLHEFYTGVTTTSKEHLLEVEVYYDLEFVQKRMDIRERLDDRRLRQAMASDPHIGVHCHVFRSETFLDTLLKPILFMGLVELDLLEFVPARGETGGELIVILARRPPRVSLAAAEFYVPPAALPPVSGPSHPVPDSVAPAPEPAANATVAAGAVEAGLLDRVRSLEATVRQLRADFQQRERIVDTVLTSRSWRLTQPLRALRQFWQR